ncbi:MAG: hypothetical protein J7521_15515 [Caulobacter sp.]|nr:hypothetical protein [Caulobacter sp.]
MTRWMAMAALALALGAAGGAFAGTPYPVKMTCPVGGEKFTFTATMSYSTWGTRPDGKPYGSWEFPAPIPECPGNRLVMFTEFSKAQVKALEPILVSSEYKALADDTSYYRALWLARALKMPDIPEDSILLQASWQADGDPVRKARYQREFVAAADVAPARPADPDWMGLQVRAANAERELGLFDAAAVRLGRLKGYLATPFPEPKVLNPEGKPIDLEAERRGLLSFIDAESVAVTRKDADPEPLDLLAPRIAAMRCMALADEGKNVPEACGKAPLDALIRSERGDIESPSSTSPSAPGP